MRADVSARTRKKHTRSAPDQPVRKTALAEASDAAGSGGSHLPAEMGFMWGMSSVVNPQPFCRGITCTPLPDPDLHPVQSGCSPSGLTRLDARVRWSSVASPKGACYRTPAGSHAEGRTALRLVWPFRSGSEGHGSHPAAPLVACQGHDTCTDCIVPTIRTHRARKRSAGVPSRHQAIQTYFGYSLCSRPQNCGQKSYRLTVA